MRAKYIALKKQVETENERTTDLKEQIEKLQIANQNKQREITERETILKPTNLDLQNSKYKLAELLSLGIEFPLTEVTGKITFVHSEINLLMIDLGRKEKMFLGRNLQIIENDKVIATAIVQNVYQKNSTVVYTITSEKIPSLKSTVLAPGK